MVTICTITKTAAGAGEDGEGKYYELDDDPARIDHDAAVAFLTTKAYWGRWRDARAIITQITDAWRVVGVYDRTGAMVGFARATSDGGTAYLADVYVLPEHRGAGLGKALVRAMIDDGPGAGQRWLLHTADAHGLYRQFGFTSPGPTVLERPREHARAPEHDPLDTGVLEGSHVRLEPLGYRHAAGLLATTYDAGDLYQWMGYLVPRTPEQVREFIEFSLRERDKGRAVPYAAVRVSDGEVIGSTRFHSPDFWPWPLPRTAPDTVEIGWTWLSAGAVRTAANTQMKTLMLTHAFETWEVSSVCLHADARNSRSRAAIERIGARFEGILRAHRLAADLIPRESARYSITSGEWPEVKLHLAELAAKAATA
jgi:RimJ/RimL family protein N-acetyltransferase